MDQLPTVAFTPFAETWPRAIEMKVPIFLENFRGFSELEMAIGLVKFANKEVRSIPVAFFPFLSLENVVPNYVMFLARLFRGLSPNPPKFLVGITNGGKPFFRFKAKNQLM